MSRESAAVKPIRRQPSQMACFVSSKAVSIAERTRQRGPLRQAVLAAEMRGSLDQDSGSWAVRVVGASCSAAPLRVVSGGERVGADAEGLQCRYCLRQR